MEREVQYPKNIKFIKYHLLHNEKRKDRQIKFKKVIQNKKYNIPDNNILSLKVINVEKYDTSCVKIVTQITN